MTARAETVIEVDGATVYAEGMLAGLRTACNLIEKGGAGLLTGRQRKAIDAVFAACEAQATDKAFWQQQRDALHAALAACELSVPPKLLAQVREWRAIAIHNQWRADVGNPAALPIIPSRDVLLPRIHTFLLMFPEFDHAD
jgi:hypothetical protein